MLSMLGERLEQLGIELPQLAAPVANYVPYRFHSPLHHIKVNEPMTFPHGNVLLYTSGMIPADGGVPLRTGKLGAEVSLEDGQLCARLCALNAIAWAKQALNGNLDAIAGVLQVRGFVACTPDFYDHPKVLNGCSDLLVEVFGERGKHTRAAVGCPSLPLNVPVEVDLIFQLG
jgi:enamine deaminase RidA (YjgF/YER057c/UK114 family)